MDLQRRLEWVPGFDKRSDNPATNYGIHGAECKFLVQGPKGVVQFVIYTNWMPRSCRIAWNAHKPAHLLQPMAADLGYHSYNPIYPDQEPMTDECQYLGGRCYYDGSSLNAEPLLDLLIEEGDGAVWARLEAKYHQTFGAE